ncbi:hypothetical protein CVT25_001226 [Psilocybe cyanescens]|uniref:Uncharacterized protein n=1 Tax=Psilocybe cyanescens TaxID=93625 RepID=A0A409XKE3_PSICY|nr:hypothetical protein CVT25_001226 [Psilocybe cyanescens]
MQMGGSLLCVTDIKVSTITQEKIEDRGKSDELSKLNAIGQTGKHVTFPLSNLRLRQHEEDSLKFVEYFIPVLP